MGQSRFRRDAASRQHARQQIRQAGLLRDGQGPRVARGVEPVAPGPAKNAVFDAEQITRPQTPSESIFCARKKAGRERQRSR